MIVQRQNSAYDRTDSTASGCIFKRATLARFFAICLEESDSVQRRENRFFAAMPSVFSVLAGVMFLAILVILIAFEPWFETWYQNRSLLSNRVLWIPALAVTGALEWAQRKAKSTRGISNQSSLWLTRGIFAAVLIVQFLVARTCWYKMGWDIYNVYTMGEELARGVPLYEPEYFRLCPNNAPLTVLQAVPLWVAVKIGLGVPFVVLPYIDAVLLNAAAYTGVRCVQMLTPSRMARGFAMVVSIGWIALSPYILYPYTDSFAILFPVLALYAWLRLKRPTVKWFVISLLCFFGASIKPTVLIVLIALILLESCRFLAQKPSLRSVPVRAVAVLAAIVIGMLPGKLFQDATTEYLAGSSKPEEQLSWTHYLMLGMNGETFGGHSVGDVEFSTSYETLAQRQPANLKRAWERLSERSLWQNVRFFAVKTYKAYADGSFAAHNSFLEMETPKRTDALSAVLRRFYHTDGTYMPLCQTAAQCLWLMLLLLCARSCFALGKRPEVALLALTFLGVTAYLLLFEVWPRYLFLYAPFFVILGSLALEKPLSFKR